MNYLRISGLEPSLWVYSRAEHRVEVGLSNTWLASSLLSSIHTVRYELRVDVNEYWFLRHEIEIFSRC